MTGGKFTSLSTRDDCIFLCPHRSFHEVRPNDNGGRAARKRRYGRRRNVRKGQLQGRDRRPHDCREGVTTSHGRGW